MKCHIDNKPFEKDEIHNVYDGYYSSVPVYHNFSMAGLSQFYNYNGLSNIGSAKIIFPSINLVGQ